MSFRKRQRATTSAGRLSSSPSSDCTSSEGFFLMTLPDHPAADPGGFNDPAAADVLLRLQVEGLDSDPALELYLQSSALIRSRYFAALLSDRWHRPDPEPSPTAGEDFIQHRLTLNVPLSFAGGEHSRRGPFDTHVAVLRLLHNLDFPGAITSVSEALDFIPVALELLFNDCVQACVRYVEAVPWTEEEEEGVLGVIPLLPLEESRDLLARVSLAPTATGDGKSMSEEMLHGLVDAAIRRHPNVATIKAFVAKLLRDYSSRDLVQKVLNDAFLSSLEIVKELLGKYASPDFRIAGDHDEREAMQRLNLHAAMVNVKHLYWLAERMIELRVADAAVREWSEQAALATDLQKTFKEDGWKNMAPGLAVLITRCTLRLATAVSSGAALVPREVRMKLVGNWLPVLNVLRDILAPLPTDPKSIYQELEETFLKIISTLPVPDAQFLLQQCLRFSTRNIDDCPHLLSAFKTWFRRASRPPFMDDCFGSTN